MAFGAALARGCTSGQALTGGALLNAGSWAFMLSVFAGGALMAIGAAFAGGCTSGQALTGGALLNLGSWAFMLMVFAGAYAVAASMRWQWR